MMITKYFPCETSRIKLDSTFSTLNTKKQRDLDLLPP